MKEKAGKPITVRLWQKNQERIEYAERIGLETASVVNQVLSEYLKDWLVKTKAEKAKELREALSAPVP